MMLMMMAEVIVDVVVVVVVMLLLWRGEAILFARNDRLDTLDFDVVVLLFSQVRSNR